MGSCFPTLEPATSQDLHNSQQKLTKIGIHALWCQKIDGKEEKSSKLSRKLSLAFLWENILLRNRLSEENGLSS